MKRKPFTIAFTICLLMLVLVFAPKAHADETVELTYELTADGNGYAVTGVTVEREDTPATELIIPGTYQGKPVTEIADAAFGYCNFTDVVIPGSVTYIGQKAFVCCPELTSITMEVGVARVGSMAFYGCEKLTTVAIPDTITYIADDAFEVRRIKTLIISEGSEQVVPEMIFNKPYVQNVVVSDSVRIIERETFLGCPQLSRITIGKGVEYVFDYAFYNCPKLAEVHISDLTKWCKISFTKGFNLPGEYANPLCNGGKLYLNGNLITDLVIPNGITEIKNRAFQGCSGIRSVTIPSSVKKIGPYAFDHCSALSELTISDGVTEIEKYAFRHCASLKILMLPDSVTSIGEQAFCDCTNLTEVTLSSNLTKYSIDNDAFAGCALEKLYYGEKTKTIWHGMTVGNPRIVVIPPSVTSIETFAITHDRLESVYICDPSAWCKVTLGCDPMETADRLHVIDENGAELTEIVLDDTVTEIPAGRFRKCKKAVRFVLGDHVTQIGEEAFYDCLNMEEIVLPKSLEQVKKSAFTNCKNLETVYYEGTERDWRLVVIDRWNEYLEWADVVFNSTGQPETPECDHYYSIWWQKDPSRHWLVCSYCGSEKDAGSHIPGPEATETEAQTCTICGYVIQAPLGHTHAFEEDWSMDDSGHWKSCSGCDIQEGYDFHIIAGDSTADGDAVCLVCGYLLPHEHQYGEEWEMDESGHWRSCTLCGEISSENGHELDPNAIEGSGHVCMVCGYVSTLAIEETEPSEEASEPVSEPEETTQPLEETETVTQPKEDKDTDETDESDKRGSPWVIGILMAVAGAAAGGAFVFFGLKKRKE